MGQINKMSEKNTFMQKMVVVVLLATICDLLWGSAFPFIKLGYLAFISAMAYSLWATLLTYNPISKVAVMGFLNPVFGVILSAIILKEGNIVNYRSVIALVLVCIGICVVYYKENAQEE